MSQSHRDSPDPAPIAVLPARANKTSISSANQSLSPANTVRQTADRRKPETEIETETEAEIEPETETETETEPESKSESETKSEAKNRSSVQVAAKIKNLDCSLVGSTCPENSNSNNNKYNEIEEKQCIKNRERIGKNESKLREKLKPRVQRRCGTLN